MRQQRSIILYLFVGLLIVTGFFLYIFKDSLVSRFLTYSINGEVIRLTSDNSNIKLDILNDSRIKALKNYTGVFDYNDLEGTQKALLTEVNNQNSVVISNPDAGSSDNIDVKKINFVQVRVGNNNPFVTSKVTK